MTKRDQYIPLSPEMIERLKAHRERTGIASSALLSLSGALPAGLTDRIVNHWFFRKAKRITARRDHYDFVLKAWEKLPTDPYVPLTEDILNELEAHRQRTGIGYLALLNRCSDLPDGLKTSTVSNWLSGNARRARKRYLDYVRSAWAAMPDCPHPKEERITISADTLEEMRRLQRETGIGPYALMRGSHDKPEALGSGMVKQWLNGGAKTAQPDCLNYVLERWRQLDRRVEMTDRMLEQLRALKEETGVGVIKLLKGADDLPARLTPGIVEKWISGETRVLSENHYRYVIERWRSFQADGARNTRVPFDQDKRDALKRERLRTGVGPRRLLALATDIPEGLTDAMVTNWLMGQNKCVSQEHYNFVCDLWRGLPDAQSR